MGHGKTKLMHWRTMHSQLSVFTVKTATKSQKTKAGFV
jgi:hypothetical protein